MAKTDWLRLLGCVTWLVNQELLLKNELWSAKIPSEPRIVV